MSKSSMPVARASIDATALASSGCLTKARLTRDDAFSAAVENGSCSAAASSSVPVLTKAATSNPSASRSMVSIVRSTVAPLAVRDRSKTTLPLAKYVSTPVKPACSNSFFNRSIFTTWLPPTLMARRNATPRLPGAIALRELTHGVDAAEGRRPADGDFEHGVGDHRLGGLRPRQPVDFASVHVEAVVLRLERHDGATLVLVERLLEHRDVQGRRRL